MTDRKIRTKLDPRDMDPPLSPMLVAENERRIRLQTEEAECEHEWENDGGEFDYCAHCGLVE